MVPFRSFPQVLGAKAAGHVTAAWLRSPGMPTPRLLGREGPSPWPSSGSGIAALTTSHAAEPHSSSRCARGRRRPSGRNPRVKTGIKARDGLMFKTKKSGRVKVIDDDGVIHGGVSADKQDGGRLDTPTPPNHQHLAALSSLEIDILDQHHALDFIFRKCNKGLCQRPGGFRDIIWTPP